LTHLATTHVISGIGRGAPALTTTRLAEQLTTEEHQ
jgi:hypothetical protein